jgi:hypothetical protein
MKHKTVKDLRKAVERQLKTGDHTTIIEMEGLQFNVDYAKYLLQYLTMRKIHEDTPLSDILVSKQ